MAAYNNLYPPILNTFMPTFDKDTACRVYFSLSPYNDITEIKGAMISVNNQKTNKTSLDSNKYPSELKLSKVFFDATRETDDKYYVEVSKEDLISQEFIANNYYKVQIRFTSVDFERTDGDGNPFSDKIESWLTKNYENFSEWSTVCLIKGITPPAFNFFSLDNQTLTTDTLIVSGQVNFGGEDSLRQYKLTLKKNNSIIYQSEDLYVDPLVNINQIYYTFPILLEDKVAYQLVIDIISKGLYQETKVYNFNTNFGFADFPATVDKKEIEVDNENARVKIHLTGTNNSTNNYLIFKRSSEKTKFQLWEDVCIYKINPNSAFDITWYDYTVESGILYKYNILLELNGKRTKSFSLINKEEDLILLLFNHTYLVQNDRQLTVKFNPNISSFKQTILENKIETIGSKYPFITRNAVVNYREIPISGLISYAIDEDDTFVTKAELYGEYADDKHIVQQQIFSKYKTNEYDDFIYERRFRDKVLEFLYDDNVKLFKSASEGNFLVKIIGVSLTPETTLGRRIFSFSGTAYEIDDCTLDNIFNKYNIITLKKE